MTTPSEDKPGWTDQPASATQEATAGPCLDPYLVWARRTGFRYLRRGASGAVRLAGELRAKHSFDQMLKSVRACDAEFHARTILDTPFFTATLSTVTPEACDALLRHASFVLAEPGMRPLDVPEPSDTPVSSIASHGRRPTTLDNDIVIGVIDGRCGFANQVFCAGDHSRLDRFWDQGDAPPAGAAAASAPWSVPAGPGYGRELERAALDAVARELSPADPAQRAELEKALYRRYAHRLPDDADWSHGTHVLGTVLEELPDHVRTGVIYVQLADAALRDTSARWTAAHVLDAIDYVVGHLKADAHAVINLSLGAFAGPHDGSSLLERAIDAIAGRYNGRVTFVVAAGNGGRVSDDGTGDDKRCRAGFTLDGGAQRILEWDIDRADDTESFVELWSPRGSDGSSAGLAVALRHSKIEQLSSGDVAPDTVRDISRHGSVVATVINNTGSTNVPNGRERMVLIALGHTRSSPAAAAPIGRWQIAVTNLDKQPVEVSVWVERRDVPGELLGYRPQYGLIEDAFGFDETGSLGSLANGRSPIVVGAFAFDEARCRYGIAHYSSRGLGADAQPQVYALGKRTSCGFFSGTGKDLAGTSVAAAQVTAALASARAAGAAFTSPDGALDALRRLASERWQAQSLSSPAAALDDELAHRVVVLPRS